jgi:G3E family GTPase
MKIMIISGFLGSGKTTLLITLAGIYAKKGLKTAIIENEIGEIPVDSMLLKSGGLTVRELFAGCICCSIRQDLSTAVMEIKQTVDPDILLIEPTGVAAPEIVTGIIGDCLSDDDSVATLLIVDYRRIEAGADTDSDVNTQKYILKLPFLARSLQVCEHILMNIPEKVDRDTLKSVVDVFSQTAGGKKIHVFDARNQECVREFAAGIEADTVKSGVYTPATVIPFGQTHLETTAVVTLERTFLPHQLTSVVQPASAISCDIAQSAETMMMKIGSQVKKLIPDAIGHIKTYITSPGAADAENQDGLFLNVVRFGDEVLMQGDLPQDGELLTLVVNAIVCNMQKGDLEEIIHDHTTQFLRLFKSHIDLVC